MIQGYMGNMMMSSSSGPSLILSYTTTVTSSSVNAGVIFNSVPFGEESEDRNILVCIMGASTTSRTITHVIYNAYTTPVYADKLYGASGFENVVPSFWMGVVPSGTTGVISVGYSGTGTSAIEVSVWALYGTPSSFIGGENTSTGAVSVPVSIDMGGCSVAGVRQSNTSSFIWSNATERYDSTLPSTSSRASVADRSTAGSVNITASSGSASKVLGVVTFTP